MEGDWTLNDVIYQRVPVSEIPDGPVLPPYPMHCDSTGFPPVTEVQKVINPPVPETFTLYPLYPNPFNNSCIIRYSLKSAAVVELNVYTIEGKLAATLEKCMIQAGTYSVQFNA